MEAKRIFWQTGCGYKRKKVVKNDPEVFHLSKQNEAVIYQNGKTVREQTSKGGLEFSFDTLRLRCLLDIQMDTVVVF